MTDLLVDHVAHGYADLHACSLDFVEVHMMKESQADGGQWDARSVAVSLVDCSWLSGVITFEILNQLPKKHRLNDFDYLLTKMRIDTQVWNNKSKLYSWIVDVWCHCVITVYLYEDV